MAAQLAGTQHPGGIQHSSLVLVLSGYGAGCPDMAQAVAMLQLLLPQAEQAYSTHSCNAAPPLPTFSSATILPSSLACSALGRRSAVGTGGDSALACGSSWLNHWPLHTAVLLSAWEA
jgi:hypothetical protein